MSTLFFDMLQAGGFIPALKVLSDALAAMADSASLPHNVAFFWGALIAVLVGFLGYRYVKILPAAYFGVLGYALGSSLFVLANARFDLDLPNLCKHVVGFALMAVLAYLSYKKIAYALFCMVWFSGFVFAYFIYPNYILAIAVGLAAAMVGMHFVRYAVILITSFGGGFLLMAMVSAMAPDITRLSLEVGRTGKALAILVSLIFAAVQYYLTKDRPEPAETKKFSSGRSDGTRRVKVRRVYNLG